MFLKRLNGNSILNVFLNMLLNTSHMPIPLKVKRLIRPLNNLKFIFCIVVFIRKSRWMSFLRMENQIRATNSMDWPDTWRAYAKSSMCIFKNGLRNQMCQISRSTQKYWTAFLSAWHIIQIVSKKTWRITVYWLRRFYRFHLPTMLKKELRKGKQTRQRNKSQ